MQRSDIVASQILLRNVLPVIFFNFYSLLCRSDSPMTMDGVILHPDGNTSDSASESDSALLSNHLTQEARGASHSPERNDLQKHRQNPTIKHPYRLILSTPARDSVESPKTEEEAMEEEEIESAPSALETCSTIYQTESGQYITITPGGAIQMGTPGLVGGQQMQTIALADSGTMQQGATVFKYAGDGTQQFFIPGSQIVVQAATGDMPSYQIRTPSSAVPQGVVVSTSPANQHGFQQVAEEATRKREIRLLKNREAARECRKKKKEYVKCLENRVAVLENQNKTLIEELKALKDLYCHKTE
uniref:BZIP domain-containing protein n=1 Tax=Leptobrachium leishanense TaxID=445787 RepID=A0A8C5MME9_9ANUR